MSVFRTLLLILSVTFFCGLSQAQLNVDNRTSVLDGQEKEERPKNIKEQLVKMQIEKDKKDHDEMVARGEEAVKLSKELETSFANSGSLKNEDLEKVEKVEKLVKKIRSELGGDDDDEDAGKAIPQQPSNPKGFVSEAIDSLRSRSVVLLEELKKTTRFSISAAAITTSNALLRLTRVLRFQR